MASDDVAAQDQQACCGSHQSHPAHVQFLPQAWDRRLGELLLTVPTDGDDSKLKPVLTAIRDHVAQRWCFLIRTSAEAAVRQGFQKCLKDLALLHREEIPWAPFPPERQDVDAGTQDDAEEADGPAERRADPKIAPHEFRFLKVEKGVWSVLVAAWTRFVQFNASLRNLCILQTLGSTGPRESSGLPALLQCERVVHAENSVFAVVH